MACIVLTCGAVVAITAGFLTGREKNPTTAAKSGDPKHKADEEAIRKASADLARALEKGDAKAVAGLWTEEGEYVADDGTTVRGRAALEAAYKKLFAKGPNLKVEAAIDCIRFVSRDSAIEEGVAKVHRGKGEDTATSRYSILYAREDGRWQIAVLREGPDDGATPRDLDWLVGTWVAKTPNGEVRTTYEWDENKTFLRVRIAIKDKDGTVNATEMIGKDPRTGGLRSWIFGSDGGFGEAAWSQDGKRWVLEATGVTPDGEELTATNILTPIDKDSFSWQSTDRTQGGESLPNIAPTKVTRAK
ncbi:MAG TPA: SgcJ/EcaC family oxidoreductase [Gemmataceae bacterium]|nr:SgcJ/EcaC family oxidoreductase [Gemmataceae bacterium]